MDDINNVFYYRVLTQTFKPKDLIVLKQTTITRKQWCSYLLLLFSSIKCSKHLAQELINRGADVNAKNKESFTPLHFSTIKGKTKITKFLLKHGANPHAQSGEDEFNPMHCAAAKGNSKILQLLLDHGANIDVVINIGQLTPLHFAAFYRHEEAVRLLVQQGANIQAPSMSGMTAKEFSRNKTITNYLEAVPQLNRGLTCAIREKNYHESCQLLRRGAQLTISDEFGNSPLHQAIIQGNRSIIYQLLCHKANPEQRNNNGDKAIERASLYPTLLAVFFAAMHPLNSK